MLKSVFYALCFCACICAAKAQVPPEIGSWIVNLNQATGYAGIATNVQKVQFSDDNVYVSATCIPGYDIGPWTANPNVPANQNFVFKITRHPAENKMIKTNTPLGHIGVWTNGVSVFNAKDGMSYNNAGIWNRNALYYEGVSFDDCLGHPAPNGEYHHHVNPTCLYNDADSLNHSPIIGYAFDGFPVYGAYGYTNINGTGTIKRMKSSYLLSTATTRVNGPPVNGTYPAGCYLEDHFFQQGSGDLDIYNGRFCITPEYPSGVYAYFVTINSELQPVFPYVLGAAYFGTVQAGNTGPGSGHQAVTETVQTFDPTSVSEQLQAREIEIYPNPASQHLFFRFSSPLPCKLFLINALGETVAGFENIVTGSRINISDFPPGVYFLTVDQDGFAFSKKIMLSR